MKPHMTLKWMLEHPKDKHIPHENSGVVYEVQCKDCQQVYTGEMERRYRVREKEHKTAAKTTCQQCGTTPGSLKSRGRVMAGPGPRIATVMSPGY